MSDDRKWPAAMKAITAADFLDISIRQLHRLREEKKIPPAVSLEGTPRYRREDLEAYVRQLRPVE